MSAKSTNNTLALRIGVSTTAVTIRKIAFNTVQSCSSSQEHLLHFFLATLLKFANARVIWSSEARRE